VRGKIIGITGGLGSGKTLVSSMFEGLGAVVIDADEIAHDLLLNDEKLKKEVVDIFGKEILTDGAIDRRKLAEEVFFDKNMLDVLSGFMHPVIIKKIMDEAENVKDKVVVIDAPLLIEAGLNEFVDVVVVVTAEREVQIRRAVNRGIDRLEAESIIENQMPLEEKVKYADFEIDNNGNIDKTKEGVEKAWQKM
jgi:dephospho-CoA kinase